MNKAIQVLDCKITFFQVLKQILFLLSGVFK